MNRRLLHIAIPTLFLLWANLTGIVQAELPEKARRERPERLWKKVLAAKGGREKLLSVSSLAISSRRRKPLQILGFEGVNTHDEYLFVLPDKYWRWTDDRPSKFGLSISMANGEKGEVWMVFDQGEPEPDRYYFTDTERHAMAFIQLVYLLETRWIKPIPESVQTRRWRGQRVDVLRATAGPYKVTYYLDQQTHLPLKIEIRGLAVDGVERLLGSVTMGEYESFSGILLPREVGRFSDETNPEIAHEYEMNPEYDPQIFERPPSLAAGPYAWRRRGPM